MDRETRDEQIREWYAAGNSVRQIAQAIGMSKSHVGRVVRRANLGRTGLAGYLNKPRELDLQWMRACHVAGMALTEVAIAQGVCRHTAAEFWKRKTGRTWIEGRGRRLDRPDVPVDEVTRLYQGGYTSVQLAEIYEISPATILNRVRDGGGKIRRRGLKPAWARR